MEYEIINLNSTSVSALEINFALKRAGLSQAKIARLLDVSASTVCSVINGKASSYQVAKFIAEKLNTSVNHLWPDRYVFRPRRNKEMDN